jgi:hypothetical protein
MSFDLGDIPHYDSYLFTDTGETARHYALVLLPNKNTQFQSNDLCCVITSKHPKNPTYVHELNNKNYPFLSVPISYVCFDRKDYVPQSGLSSRSQPVGKLKDSEVKNVFKKLKNSLYRRSKDIASDPYVKGTIIYEWKKKIHEIEGNSLGMGL